MTLKQEHIDIDKFIDRIEFTPIITGITYKDGSGSFAVCSEEDFYDPEKGFAFALLNRIFGHNLWKDYVRKFVPKTNSVSASELNEQIEILQLEAIKSRETIHNLQDKIIKLSQHNEKIREELDRYELAYNELYENFEKLYQEKKQKEEEEKVAAPSLSEIKSQKLREILSQMKY